MTPESFPAWQHSTDANSYIFHGNRNKAADQMEGLSGIPHFRVDVPSSFIDDSIVPVSASRKCIVIARAMVI
ncbi:hypothetical protein AAC387_Pa08g0562 [Persea americana]